MFRPPDHPLKKEIIPQLNLDDDPWHRGYGAIWDSHSIHSLHTHSLSISHLLHPHLWRLPLSLHQWRHQSHQTWNTRRHHTHTHTRVYVFLVSPRKTWSLTQSGERLPPLIEERGGSWFTNRQLILLILSSIHSTLCIYSHPPPQPWVSSEP